MRRLLTAAALVSGLALGGCKSFDPLDKLQELDIMGTSKKPLVGDRRAVFPEGVPGVAQGVPPDLVKGYQPPAETPPPVVAAKPEKPKPKKKTVSCAAQTTRRATGPAAADATGARRADHHHAAGRAERGRRADRSRCAADLAEQRPPAPGPWPGPQR